MKLHTLLIACLTLGTAQLTQAQTVASIPPATAALPGGSPTLDDIRKRDKLLVGNKFGFQTFNYRDAATGRYEGYMADLARSLAKRMLGDGGKVEFRKTTDETRFEMLDRREIDLIIDLTPSSEEKLAHADFSDEIFRSGSGLLVKKGSAIRGASDLRKGTRVLYVTENQDIEKLRALAPEATYVGFENSKDAFAALKAGKGDAFTQVVTHLYRAASQDPDYVVVSRFTEKPYYIAFRKGDAVLREYLNAALRAMRESGDMDRLFAKWFEPYGGVAAK